MKMKEYLKMADVFHSEIYTDDESGSLIVDDEGIVIASFSSDKVAYYALHAINSHDHLVGVNCELLDALTEIASSLSWPAHGECRAFSDGPILTSHEAINKAKLAISKAKGGAT